MHTHSSRSLSNAVIFDVICTCLRVASLSTVSQQEVDKFAAEAAEWWRSDGPALPLHAMNELRVPFVRNALTGYHLEDTNRLPTPDVFPLAGRTIVDVGCGPGILCEVKGHPPPHTHTQTASPLLIVYTHCPL